MLNNSSIHFYFPAQRRRVLDTRGGGGGGTPYDGLYEVYERVGISLVEVYKRVGTSVIYGFIKSRKRSIFVIDSY